MLGRTRKRVAALRSKRSDGEVDDRRRDRDLRVLEPDRACQRENSFLEIGGRIAGLVPGTREPEQELGVLRRLWLAHACGRTRFQTVSRTTARPAIAMIAMKVSGEFLSVSTAKNASTIAVTASATSTMGARAPISARSR